MTRLRKTLDFDAPLSRVEEGRGGGRLPVAMAGGFLLLVQHGSGVYSLDTEV